MKKFIFLLLVFLCSMSTYAQKSGSIIDVQELTRTLTLDAVQIEKITTLELFRAQQMQELAGIKSSNKVLYNNKLKAINSNTIAKLKNIFSPEQLNTYQLQLERKEKEKFATAKRMKAAGASKEDVDNILNNN